MAEWAKRRRIAALLLSALTIFFVAHPTVAGAATTAVDDSVTAVVNAVDGRVSVLANDTRPRGGPFNAFAVVRATSGATAAGGSYSCASLACLYTAPPGYLGADSFPYQLAYPAPGGTTAAIAGATVSVTVVANDAPTAVDDELTIRGHNELDLAENDTDPNRSHAGETLTVAPMAITTAAGSTVTCPSPSTPGRCEYRVAPGFSGTDQFDYTVADRNGATDVGTATLVVLPNHPPVAVDDAVAARVRYGATSLPLHYEVTTNDTDADGDWLSAQPVSPTTSAGGAVECSGSWCSYTPPTGFFGADTFTYRAHDGMDASSAPATVTVTVSDDLPPVAVADSASTKGTRPVEVAVLVNDSDDRAGGPSLIDSWTAGGSDAASANGGTVACLYATCTYTPPAGFVGTDTFAYVVSDDASTASATVTVTVGANVAPLAQDDTPVFRVDDGDANDGDYHITLWVLANDTDPDGDPLTAEGAGTTTSGLEWYCFDQRCEVIAPEGFVGVETFSYTASDGFGGTDGATVALDIDTLHTGSPDTAPDAAATSTGVPVTVDVLANDVFYDSIDPSLTVRAGTTASAAGGTVVCSSANCTYTPPAGFAGTDTFTYKALTRYLNGAHETVTVEVVAGQTGTTPDGGTFSTGTTPTAADPLTTSVLTPVGGPVVIAERPVASPTPVGHALFAQEVAVTTPGQSATAPLQVTFLLDSTLLGGAAPSAVKVWRDGTAVANCVGGTAATAANPDPCVKQRASATGGDARIVVLSSVGGVWTFGKVVATAPSAPTAVTASAGIRSITATWAAPAQDGGAPIGSYQVTATPVAVPAGATAVARTVTITGSPAATTATVTGLVNGVTYVVTVRARNTVSTTWGPASDAGAPTTTPSSPAAPSIDTTTGGVRRITATWTAPADGGSPITSYRLTATPVGGGTARSVTVAAPATIGTVTGLADGTAHTVTVTATNAAGTSAASAPTTATTTSGIPSAPTGAVATPGVRSLAVTWSAPLDDGGAPISQYRVTATPVPETVPAGVAASARTVTVTGTPPTTATTVTGLVNGVTYTVTVTARNSAVGTFSSPSAPITARVLALPAAPSMPTVVAGPTTAVVTWDAPASDATVTGYTVRASAPRPGTTAHTVSRTLTGAPPATGVTLTGLIAGLDYTVTVAATSSVGAGPASAPGTVRPTVGISVTDRTANEGNSGTTAFTFTVRLSSAQTGAVTVDVATVDGTAGASDLTPLATTVTFAPGQTSRTVTVLVAGDLVDEPDETFTFVLSNPSTGGFTKASGLGTIVDDDA